MRALWKGYIVLGQLGIPIRLYAATKDTGIQFIQLHDADLSPIERPLFCKKEHKEISHDEVVRGVEIEPGKYVTFTNQELEQRPETSMKAVEIRQFCSPEQISPLYFKTPYYVAAAKGGEHAYVLLREGLARTNSHAIGRFFFYGNEYMAALMVQEDILILQRLRFADEIVPRTEIRTPALPSPRPSELDIMSSVIRRHSGPVYMQDYHNEYAERLQLLSERKAKGLPLARPEQPLADTTPEKDIQSVLSQMAEGDTKLLSAKSERAAQ
jgi:DNA end-binding protein Ku